jgi:hypothetical protein
MTRNAADGDEAVEAVVVGAEAAIVNVRSKGDLPPDVNVRRSHSTTSAYPTTTETPSGRSAPNEITTRPKLNEGTMGIAHGDRCRRAGPQPMTIVRAADAAAAAAAGAVDARAKPPSGRPPTGRARAMGLTSTTNRCP